MYSYEDETLYTSITQDPDTFKMGSMFRVNESGRNQSSEVG